ncbi:MAG: S9 family peptidase, partial [Acidobacteriota bacterium]|nr:S9 family peptidase [Acidobacteriota bacterium]
MRKISPPILMSAFLVLCAAPGVLASEPLKAMDVFELEYTSSPSISPDGKHIVYLRHYMDVMKDTRRANLWIVGVDGSGNRPLTNGKRNDSSPVWAPDGSRIYFVSSDGESRQLHAYWTATHQITSLTRLTRSPSGLSISPDGKWMILSMSVPSKQDPLASLPSKPKGAEW